MRVAVTGSHGLVAGHLLPALRAAGHDVVRIVRGEARPGEVVWDPDAGRLDAGALEGIDAAIHLAGVGIFKRWTAEHKRQVRDSRVRGTRLLAERMAGLDRPPRVLISGSAVGWYGDRGDEELTEASGPGTGFLADVCREWEAAAAPAVDAGIRTVLARTGIVLSTTGGALATQLPIFRLGLGGRLGNGRQWTSWIHVDDEVGALIHALDHDDVVGPLNLTAPHPVTNAEFTSALGRALHRPAVLIVPGPVLDLALGREMAGQMLLGGQRVLPTALVESGYSFAHPGVDDALDDLVGSAS